MFLLPPGFSLLIGPLPLTRKLLPKQHAYLPHLYRYPQYRQPIQSRPSQRPTTLTSKLLRTFQRMAASKPTSSLSMVIDTLYPLTLDWYFGTLTVVWVVPLSGLTLTTSPRLLKSTMQGNLELDQKPKDFSPQIPNPYLYHPYHLVQGLTTANFNRNQLLPVSIGFSPLSASQKNTCSQHLFGPPRCFDSASPYPRIDRPASGLILVTLGTFIPSPWQTAGLLVSLRMLHYQNYPCHQDKLPGTLFKTHDRTPQGTVPLQLLGFRGFSHPVKGSFQLSLTVLVRYRTLFVFKVGS
eukprot:TRINITY_DN2609_c0_g1_i2.p1 TRINITY_DN2609_c0_g1~~TRINITY_DN2609_c0_g1_i2.p1  ORF type:complete len:295 (+),score=-66.29 TRINITY_DN2609_c0_g1_i2:100-984(+)